MPFARKVWEKQKAYQYSMSLMSCALLSWGCSDQKCPGHQMPSFLFYLFLSHLMFWIGWAA